MKILLINPNKIDKPNWGHQLFRNEIGRQHEVIYYGKGFKNYKGRGARVSISEIINKCCDGKPDLLLTYDSYANVKNPGMGEMNDIIKININVDYEGNVEKQNRYFASHKYDLIFAVVESSLNIMKEHNVCKKLKVLPFSVDTNIYKNLGLAKTNDVCAVYTVKDTQYLLRGKIHEMLEKMKIKTISNNTNHLGLINAINESKITITSNNKFKHLSMRYTETLACGGFLLADKPNENDFDILGFVDGKHLVIYDGLKDLKRKINYYLNPKNEKERETIAKAGMDHVRKNHSCKARVQTMTDIIKNEFPERLSGK